MKTFQFFLLILLSNPSYSQFQRGFEEAEIYFRNNQSIKGFIYDDFAQNDFYGKSDFKQTGSVSGNSSIGAYPSIVSFQTIIKTIYFKQHETDGQQTGYPADSIDFITVSRSDEIQKYKTMKVIRADLKSQPLKFDTLNRLIWLPVLKEGKINMYGYYSWALKKSNGWAEVYFQREGEEYAVNPIQSHKLNVNAQRHGIRASLLKIFNDCPKFEENIETIIDTYLQDFHEARKLTNEEKNKIKQQRKELRDMTEFEIREQNSYVPYENILNKYYEYCGQ